MLRTAFFVVDLISWETGTIPKSSLNATRFGKGNFPRLFKNELNGEPNDKGSSSACPTLESSISATSVTFRAIGPSTHKLSKGCNLRPRGTKPILGLSPTTLLKAAGVLKLPPRSFPVASQTCPLAKAAAEPPDEPPAVRPKLNGLRVTPWTGLNVCPPAHSGTLDLPTGFAPLSSN